MKRTLFALALAAALPMTAQARGLEYSFVELDYSQMNVDDDGGLDLDPRGFGIKGSLDAGEHFYVFGGYTEGNDEIADVDVDIDTTQVGVGFKLPVADTVDFNAELSYLHVTTDIGENIPVGVPCGCGGGGFIPNEGDDADGYRASAGVRAAMGPNFEGYAKANYTDGSDFDGDFSATLGGQVKFGGMWGVTAEAEVLGDVDVYTVGIRASF